MHTLIRRTAIPFAAFTVSAMVSLNPLAASAATPDPVGDLLGQVQTTTENVVPDAPKPSATPDLPSVSGPEEADDPAPTKATAKSVEATVEDDSIAEVSGNKSTLGDDDSADADSTLVGVGGQKVLGSEASSDGDTEDQYGDFLQSVCTATGGLLCVPLLYSDSEASETATTSQASSQSGVLAVCLGGSMTGTGEPCTGPVALGVGTSQSEVDRDKTTGRTTGSSSSDLATACLTIEAGDCTVGADVLHADGSADSADPASADGDSSVVGADVADENVAPLDDPTDVSVLSGCTDSGLACVMLNRVGNAATGRTVGTTADAATTTVTPGQLDVFAGVSQTGTSVSQGTTDSATDDPATGDDPSTDGVTPVSSIGTDASTDAADSDDSILPSTGGAWFGFIGIGALLVAAGSAIVTLGRNRKSALVS